MLSINIPTIEGKYGVLEIPCWSNYIYMTIKSDELYYEYKNISMRFYRQDLLPKLYSL